MSCKIDFKAKKTIRGRELHDMMMKELICEEDIEILNNYKPKQRSATM